MTVIEVLTKARAIIARPEAWTQHAFARNAQGSRTGYFQDDACQWCAGGALALVTHRSAGTEFADACEALAPFMKNPSMKDDYPSVFNDAKDRTHAEVLAAFDRAIAALSQTAGDAAQ